MNSRIRQKLYKRGGFKKWKNSRVQFFCKALKHSAGLNLGRLVSLSESNKHMHFSKASLIIGKDGKMRLKYHNKRKRRNYRRKNI